MNSYAKRKALISALALAFVAVPITQALGGNTVDLAGEGDVIANSLPTATNYFDKEILVGQRERAEIEAQGNFTPQTSRLKFFYGESAGGGLAGTVLFLRMKTRHGRFVIGVALDPDGSVSNVVVSRAPAEAVPWFEAAQSAGIGKKLDGLGMKTGSDPLQNVSENAIGPMPYFAAEVMAAAAVRAVVYYQVLFLPRLRIF